MTFHRYIWLRIVSNLKTMSEKIISFMFTSLSLSLYLFWLYSFCLINTYLCSKCHLHTTMTLTPDEARSLCKSRNSGTSLIWGCSPQSYSLHTIRYFSCGISNPAGASRNCKQSNLFGLCNYKFVVKVCSSNH